MEDLLRDKLQVSQVELHCL